VVVILKQLCLKGVVVYESIGETSLSTSKIAGCSVFLNCGLAGNSDIIFKGEQIFQYARNLFFTSIH